MGDSLDQDAALIGAILFLENDPADEKRIASISGLPIERVNSALGRLCAEYENPVHGFKPVLGAGGWMFSPKLELWEQLKESYGKKNESRLSKAAMETLAIVAYSQPVTRAEIEAIRGVSADGMMRYLLAKNLVKELGKKDSPGKPMQYGTTQEFLKFFKISTIADLPKLDEIERDRFRTEEDEQG